MAMRWRWPPENSWGKRVRCSAPRPTSPRCLHHPLGQFPAPEAVGGDQRLADDAPDPHARIEGGIGILEDDGKPLAPGLLCLVASALQIDALETHLAAIGAQQAQQRKRHRRLAAAGLSHQRQGFPRGHREADILDRANDAVARGEMLGQMIDGKKRRHAAGDPAAAPAPAGCGKRKVAGDGPAARSSAATRDHRWRSAAAPGDSADGRRSRMAVPPCWGPFPGSGSGSCARAPASAPRAAGSPCRDAPGWRISRRRDPIPRRGRHTSRPAGRRGCRPRPDHG